MEQKKRKPYDPLLKYRRKRTIEKLQDNPLKKPVKKKAKKTVKKPAKLQNQLTPQTQPRDDAGKFAKVPLSERGFFGKLKAFRNSEMRRSITQFRRRNMALDLKHIHGIDPSPSRRRRRKK